MKINEQISATLNKDSVTFKFHAESVNVKNDLITRLSKQLVDLTETTFPNGTPLKKNNEIDWSKIPVGTPFTALVHNGYCTGKIQKQYGQIFLCQNNHFGDSCTNRLGYKQSWTLLKGDIVSLTNGAVNVSKIIFKKATVKEMKLVKKISHAKECAFITTSYPIKIHTGSVRVGCQPISNMAIKKLVKALPKKTKKLL